MRVRTWMRVDDTSEARQMIEDAAMLGDLEGLCGHAAAARIRLPSDDGEGGAGSRKRSRAAT